MATPTTVAQGINAWLPAMVMRPSRGSTGVGLADGCGWRSGPELHVPLADRLVCDQDSASSQHLLYDAKV
jgi:hypothetical protein